MPELTFAEIITILIILFAGVFLVAREVIQRGNPDAAAVKMLQNVQDNRPLMEFLEREAQRHEKLMNAFISALHFSVATTGIEMDNELLKLMIDAKTPGAPVPDQTIEISTGQPPLMPEVFTPQSIDFTPDPEGEDTVNITVNTDAA